METNAVIIFFCQTERTAKKADYDNRAILTATS